MQMLFYSYLKPQRFLYYLSITSGQITTDFMSLRHKTMFRLTPLWVGYFSWAPPGGSSPGLPWGHPVTAHLVLDLVRMTQMALLAVVLAVGYGALVLYHMASHPLTG